MVLVVYLINFSNLFLLLERSLRTLAIMKVLESKLKQDALPQSIRFEIQSNYLAIQWWEPLFEKC